MLFLINILLENELADLIIGDDVVSMLQKQNLLENKANMTQFKNVLRAIGEDDLAKELSICLSKGEYFRKLRLFASSSKIFAIYFLTKMILV